MEHLDRYRNLVYRYLSICNRSEKEVRDYLTRRNASFEIIEHLVELLKKQKFLDDELFARSWVSQRARFKPKGKQLLKIELQQKGITKELIEKILAEKNEELPDELEQAKNLIARRMEKLQGKPRQEIYTKVGNFLARRGFSWEIIKKAIDDGLGNRV